MNRAAPEPKDNMGQPEPRIDGRLKVTGAARYRVGLAGQQSGLRVSGHQRDRQGRDRRAWILHDAKARARRAGDLHPRKHRRAEDRSNSAAAAAVRPRSIQDFGPEIQHDGQIIAMVVADTFEAAREAAYRSNVSYTAEKPSATFESPGVKIEEQQGHRAAQEAAAGRRCRRGVTKRPRSSSKPNTGRRPSITIRSSCSPPPASGSDDKLTIYEPSQFVYGLKNGVAQKLGIEADKVHVVSPFVGGAFGSQGAADAAHRRWSRWRRRSSTGR